MDLLAEGKDYYLEEQFEKAIEKFEEGLSILDALWDLYDYEVLQDSSAVAVIEKAHLYIEMCNRLLAAKEPTEIIFGSDNNLKKRREKLNLSELSAKRRSRNLPPIFNNWSRRKKSSCLSPTSWKQRKRNRNSICRISGR